MAVWPRGLAAACRSTPLPCQKSKTQISEPSGRTTPTPKRKIFTERPQRERAANMKPVACGKRRIQRVYPRHKAAAFLIMTEKSSTGPYPIIEDARFREMTAGSS
jgi:hypothetical protein